MNFLVDNIKLILLSILSIGGPESDMANKTEKKQIPLVHDIKTLRERHGIIAAKGSFKVADLNAAVEGAVEVHSTALKNLKSLFENQLSKKK